uniref:Uncharacterized protein n=1 Tax=Alexandrium monilatum TaxID=311494 RepID=A0A7S4QLE9_9DINO|mmetsp:Transcript_82363/g.254586  ORF Transcript_82363/g.254586 Transcript_82363/m.254586 type:complete len:227 (-) Transcript_82363:83-763(-)
MVFHGVDDRVQFQVGPASVLKKDLELPLRRRGRSNSVRFADASPPSAKSAEAAGSPALAPPSPQYCVAVRVDPVRSGEASTLSRSPSVRSSAASYLALSVGGTPLGGSPRAASFRSFSVRSSASTPAGREDFWSRMANGQGGPQAAGPFCLARASPGSSPRGAGSAWASPSAAPERQVAPPGSAPSPGAASSSGGREDFWRCMAAPAARPTAREAEGSPAGVRTRQ